MSRAKIGVLKRKDLASRSEGLIVANDTRSGRGQQPYRPAVATERVRKPLNTIMFPCVVDGKEFAAAKKEGVAGRGKFRGSRAGAQAQKYPIDMIAQPSIVRT